MAKDIVTIEGDKMNGQTLLQSFMKRGKRVSKPSDIKEIKEYTLEQLSSLPLHFKNLKTVPSYPVEISEKLSRLKEKTERILNRE